MSRHPDPQDVMAWCDGELRAERAAEIAGHVSACPECRALTDDWADVTARAAAWRVSDPPASIAKTVQAASADPRSRRVAPAAPRHTWRRHWWQPVAAAVIVVGVLIGREVSVCGEVLCRRTAPPSLVEVARSAQASSTTTSPSSDALTSWWESLPQVPLGVPADTKVVAVWFVDYECPACAASDPVYEPLLEDFARAHPGDVTVIVRDWPWNAECNPYVPTTFGGHEASCAAAAAVHLAAARGTGEAMKAWLFSHQGGTTIAEVRDAARTVGGVTDFDEQYPTEIDRLRGELSALGNVVSATPSCFVNGRLASEGQGRLLSPENLERVLTLELQRQEPGRK